MNDKEMAIELIGGLIVLGTMLIWLVLGLTHG